MKPHPNSRFLRIPSIGGVVSLALIAGSAAFAQDAAPAWLSSQGAQQLQQVVAAKQSFSGAEAKVDSNLVFANRLQTNAASVSSFRSAIGGLSYDSAGRTPVNIYGTVSPDLLQAIRNAGGVVRYDSPKWGVVSAAVPLAGIISLAARPDVKSILRPSPGHTNVGALTSQGYISHGANVVVNSLKFNGSGVTVGVLSDSASAASIAAGIASGDLPANTTVLPGQEGSGEDEGTAMMQIVHDIAPGASLIFATANVDTDAEFADNIIALQQAGCNVIVDDYTYFDEGVFQDGPIAQAVNQVVAAGAVYFSAAANNGNLTLNTSGTWEGDFRPGGKFGNLLLLNFGTGASPQTYDVLTGFSTFIDLKWSDPLGGSTNDYDLYVFDSTGTNLKAISANRQTGTQDPYEAVFEGINCGTPTAAGYCPAVGDRILVTLFSGASRAMHLDTERGTLSIGTDGATFGHNAAAKTITAAATFWDSANTGTVVFAGLPNINEMFSSDGPRKIFYNPDGSPITPGNLLFTTNGGKTLLKPDIAAADGVVTTIPALDPFFGTSAAAPHAAGIAALILSARPEYSAPQVETAMAATALDSMEAGPDRDSGYGIVIASRAVAYALSH